VNTADSTNQKVLYTPRQIYAASFLGSPLCAAWFLRKNFLATSNPGLASKTTWRAIVLTTALLVVGYFLPERFPNFVLPLLYSFLIYQYALSIFGKPVKDHLDRGGTKGSWWEVLGVSIVSLIAIFAVAIVVLYALDLFGLLPKDSSGA